MFRGGLEIVEGLDISDFSRDKMDATAQELTEEMPSHTCWAERFRATKPAACYTSLSKVRRGVYDAATGPDTNVPRGTSHRSYPPAPAGVQFMSNAGLQCPSSHLSARGCKPCHGSEHQNSIHKVPRTNRAGPSARIRALSLSLASRPDRTPRSIPALPPQESRRAPTPARATCQSRAFPE